MGLFDRKADKAGKDDKVDESVTSGDVGSTAAAGRVDHGDDDLFDAIDSVDGIDVPDVTRPLSVPQQDGRRDEPGEDAGEASSGNTSVVPPDRGSAGQTGSAAPSDDAQTADSAGSADAEADEAGSAKPKRDIYAMSGRARPQRIEPRAAEPVKSPEPSDDARTEVFGAAAADPAYGATGDEDQNQTLAFGGSAAAAGAGRAVRGADDADYAQVPPATSGGTADSPETSVFAAGVAGEGAEPRTLQDDSAAYSPVSPVSPEDPAADAAGGAVVEDPRRGTLDFGLFILRVVIGAMLVVRGLQTLFAFGGDPGISAFEQMLSAYNFADILAVAVPVAQIVAGGLLVFGLLTPVGSALTVAVAGFLALHNMSIWDSGYWPYTLSPQVQFWGLTGLAGLVLTFTGPGRYSADVSRGWATRPLASAWVFSVVGLVGAAGLWLAVGGGNPF
ncbi:DoxX family membrane protein [Corynebacteriaceae bacterium 7-707]